MGQGTCIFFIKVFIEYKGLHRKTCLHVPLDYIINTQKSQGNCYQKTCVVIF